MKISKLLESIKTLNVEGKSEFIVQGIADDSRDVENNFMFVALRGHTVDGHEYIDQAIERGAKCIVCEEMPEELDKDVVYIEVEDTDKALGQLSYDFYGQPDKHLKMIGITGTNGKTSSTYFIKSILEAKGLKVGVIGTNGAVIIDDHFELPNTTPLPLLLHQTLANMVEAGCDACVMEVSSHGLKLGRVDYVHFDYGLFTNLTQDHLDFHHDMEDYYLSKKRLFTEFAKKAIINVDDEYGRRLIKELGDSIDITTYGIDEESDVTTKDIHYHLDGVEHTIVFSDGKKAEICVGTPGNFTVYNTMMSAIVSRELGCTIEDIENGLNFFKGVKGRFQVVQTETPYHVIIDFAHTADSLEKILQTIQEFKTGRLVTIFGAGGDRDRTKRPEMGKVAGTYSDFVIVTSDNPRSEDPDRIIDDIIIGLDPVNKNYVRITDRREAIYYAIDHAQEEDIIVLAGKGHETYVLIKGNKYPFDEEEIVLDYVNKIRENK